MQNQVRVERPQQIYEVLRELRQSALAAAAPGMPPVRSTVLNLVAYASDRMQAAEMAAQAAALAEQHPSRTIVISVDPLGLAGDWDIHVAAHCHPAVSGHVVCFEAVQLVAHGDAVPQLPAVALSLLLRDLPVVLWWPGDVPFGSPLFEQLIANSDRVLVDTASASDPEEMLRRLAALSRDARCTCAISDYAWYRLLPWRELTAQFFDTPDCRSCVQLLEGVRLELSAAPEERVDWTPAYLLTGWLATRLGWTPDEPLWSQDGAGLHVHLRQGRRPVTIDLVQVEEMGAEPGLRELALRAAHPEGPAMFVIRRAWREARAEVVTRLPGHEERQRIVPFAMAGPTELLSMALRDMGRDATYEDALHFAAFLSAEVAGRAAEQPAAS